MRRVAIAFLAIGLLTLSGCSLVSRATTVITNPSLAQLATVATSADAPSGFTFKRAGDEYAASKNYSESLDYWSKSGGSPASCLPIFLASDVAEPADTAAAGNDRFIKIGSFTDANVDYDALYVKARQFPTPRAATAFMASVPAAAASCTSGYSLTANESVFWATQSFHVNRRPSLSYGGALSVISDEEVLAPGGVDAGYRSVLMQRGTAVVAVVSEIASGRDVDFTAADSIVSAVAGRLAKLP